ncbi:MAG: VOC family protein [Thermoplasmata archaeon]
MLPTYLVYFGIRVTDIDRSLKFYTRVFGLKEVARGDNFKGSDHGLHVLLRDPSSGQKLELNWYPPGSEFAPTYEPGEALDHLAFQVEDLPRFLDALRSAGVDATDGSANHAHRSGARVAYIKDPDGNWIELYDRPSKAVPASPIEGY